MILSLYLMTICFCIYGLAIENDCGEWSLAVLLLGIAFFWIANVCYDKTITKLREDIRELREEIKRMKERYNGR